MPIYRSTALPISIHALREEGDVTVRFTLSAVQNFYPRPPRGGRLYGSTGNRPNDRISIHALREEGDAGGRAMQERRRDFYPRPPRGGRQERGFRTKTKCTFLSTPSARRATAWRRNFSTSPKFLSTPSARRATHQQKRLHLERNISIHALREEGDILVR